MPLFIFTTKYKENIKDYVSNILLLHINWGNILNFKFEVEDMILSQKKSCHHTQNDIDNLFCSFVFTTPEWKHIEKYAVFWNRKGKSTVRYLGTGVQERCELPEIVLNDLHFFVQVYANDDVYTQKLKVFTQKDVPIKKKKQDKKQLNEFFTQMENKIDNIVYDNGKFLVYANNKLVNSIDVIDEKLMSRILEGLAPQFIIDEAAESEDLPISVKIIYKALRDKVDIGDLALVAFTGDYNDLENKPESFPVEEHTHNSNDIIDLEDSVEQDFDDFLDDLIESL